MRDSTAHAARKEHVQDAGRGAARRGPADGVHRLLTNLELIRLGRLNLASRFTVEGQLQGAHPSPLKGFSVEFADYRQYVPGDDLRHLDWRVFGRRERLYIRQYAEECNLRLYLLLDGSASMHYGAGTLTKYQYAARLAAALAYVTVQQQDSAGLTVFNSAQTVSFPARSGSAHLRLLANALADFRPAGAAALSHQVHRLAADIPRRALVVVLSDLYDDLDQLKVALARFRRRKHDVIVYHILDPSEIEFPFADFGNFEDLETQDRLLTDPRAIRHAYQELFADFLKRARGLGAGLDLDYNLVTTDTDFVGCVRQHLSRRQRLA